MDAYLISETRPVTLLLLVVVAMSASEYSTGTRPFWWRKEGRSALPVAQVSTRESRRLKPPRRSWESSPGTSPDEYGGRMPSDRVLRRVARVLDDAEAAADRDDWATVADLTRQALALDDTSEDARGLLSASERMGAGVPQTSPTPVPSAQPASFAAGRYLVKKFLGEGGKKKVFLAHDGLLDRDVAFALIKTDGLDVVGRERITREAQAMGRLGSHPQIMTVFDLGETDGQPFMVTELMDGGDVEGLLEKAGGALPLERSLDIARAVCQGLEFAHARGIVHRDLKPGNVWLTADGLAKIGDFGLAVALDRSRLTMHGMMVGTVSYMPPEQALGGEVTPRSDLYSLGAMLYEMVTGQPPFMGSDPTAIISQHINMLPVAPSWKTEHCPPELEELILRMLAKDADQRPASATDVNAVLDGIDPARKSVTHTDSNVLDRLATGVFVGRETELERLRKAFDEAFAGRGSLVMLVGEPGIGKTRAAQELETYARMRGAQMVWGQAHESSGAPPYWPWVQVGRSYAAANDIGELESLMQGAARELIPLFPELRQNNAEPDAVTDPAAAQFRLFEAYASFVRAMSVQSPLLIVLDDLQWADKPTLLLLQHVARELAKMRVLIVGTYRDTDLSRIHPLSEALATLNREAGFSRIVLRGLSRSEVDGYIRATANVAPAPRLVDRIFEETEGNPFFLAEVNLLTQEGALTNESVSDIAVPDGVREALGRRLDRISEETNKLLQVAAVVGREFAYDVLTLLGERSEEELLRLIEEGLGARVIEEMEQPGRYRFTHALMQETLLGELSTTRRVRLRGQVGEALEKRWGALADERASRLAQHFVEAALLTPRYAAKAVRYAKLAARQAEAQTEWREAAKWYERAITLVTETEGGFGEDEAELLVALGTCQRNDLQWRAAWRNLTRAIALYRERGDGVGLARATIEATAMGHAPGRRNALLDEALTVLAGADSNLEAQLLLLEGFMGVCEQPTLLRVKEILRDHDFADIRALHASASAFRALSEMQFGEAEELFVSSREQLVEMRASGPAGVAATFAGLIPLLLGDLERGEDAAWAALETTRQIHSRLAESAVELRLAGLALSRCDFETFERLHGNIGTVGGYGAALQLAARAAIDGEIEKALSLLPGPEAACGLPAFIACIHAARARITYLSGDLDAARTELGHWAAAMANIPELPYSFARFYPLTELGEALPALADDATAQATYDELMRCAPVRWDPTTAHGADSIRGALAIRLGLVEPAATHFETGLDFASKWELPLEAGRCLMGLAQVSESRGYREEAAGYLEQAGTLFSRHRAKLHLDQALAKKQVLKA